MIVDRTSLILRDCSLVLIGADSSWAFEKLFKILHSRSYVTVLRAILSYQVHKVYYGYRLPFTFNGQRLDARRDAKLLPSSSTEKSFETISGPVDIGRGDIKKFWTTSNNS